MEAFKREEFAKSDVLDNVINPATKLLGILDQLDDKTLKWAKSMRESVNAFDTGKLSGLNSMLEATDKINKQTAGTIQLEKEKIKLQQLSEKARIAQIQLLNKQATEEAKLASEQRKSEEQTKRQTQAEAKRAKGLKQLSVEEAILIREQQQALAKTKAFAQLRTTEVGTLANLEARTKLYEMRLQTLTPVQIETTKQGQRYLNQLIATRGELQKQQASYGRHTLNVGNYASAYNGLGNSISQVARELPAFANSMQTGFLAISNNLPILFDEISKIKQANAQLAADGQKTTSVLSQIGKNLVSPMMLLNTFTILLTLLGPKLVDFVSGFFKGAEALDEAGKKQKYMNEQAKKSREYVANESSEFVGLLEKLKATNAGSKERSKLITEINNKYGTTLKNMANEASFQDQINRQVIKYIDYQKAKFKLQQYDEKIQLNLKTQMKLQADLAKSENQERIQREQYEKELAKGENANLRRLNLINGARNKQFRVTEDLNKQLDDANKRLETYGYGILETEKGMDDFSEKTISATKSLKEFNVELSKFDKIVANINNYDTEIQLRFDIQNVFNESQLNAIQQKFNGMKERVLQGMKETGQYVDDELLRMINDEFDLRKKMITDQAEFEIEVLKDKTQVEQALRLREIEDEKKAKEQELNDSEKQLRAEGKLTAEQQALINKARIDLDRNYQQERKKISEDIAEQERLLALETEKINAQKNLDITQNEQGRIEALNGLNQELFELEKEYNKKLIDEADKRREEEEKKEKEHQEKMQDWRNRLIEKGLEALKKASEEREKLIDKEIQASEKLSEALQNQANQGTITAQQSLAEQQQITAQKNLEKQKEQQLQQQLEEIKLLYQAVEHYVDKGDTIPVATGKAFLEVKGLKAIAGNLKGFFTGTKRTVGEELGAPVLPGRDGHIIRVDGSEMIFNGKQTAKADGATTDEVLDGYLFAKAISKGALNHLSMGGNKSMFDDRILKKFDSLEETIKNKKEFEMNVEQLGKGMIAISSKTKTGNDIIYNKFIVKP